MTERVDQAQLLHVPMGNEQAKEEKRERGEKGGNQNSQTKVEGPKNLSQMRTRKRKRG
jgi:hypothetical protein